MVERRRLYHCEPRRKWLRQSSFIIWGAVCVKNRIQVDVNVSGRRSILLMSTRLLVSTFMYLVDISERSTFVTVCRRSFLRRLSVLRRRSTWIRPSRRSFLRRRSVRRRRPFRVDVQRNVDDLSSYARVHATYACLVPTLAKVSVWERDY